MGSTIFVDQGTDGEYQYFLLIGSAWLCKFPEVGESSMITQSIGIPDLDIRRTFIGGSDARIIMGDDEPAFLRLWREKRGEAEPEDLSDNLVVQLGVATEGPQSVLVRTEYRYHDHGRPAAYSPPGSALDGGYA